MVRGYIHSDMDFGQKFYINIIVVIINIKLELMLSICLKAGSLQNLEHNCGENLYRSRGDPNPEGTGWLNGGD